MNFEFLDQWRAVKKCQNLTFKVNFLCQKLTKSFYSFSLKKIILGAHFLLLTFLRGWLLVLGLKEGLFKCATVCIKSEVILLNIDEKRKQKQFFHEFYNICKNSDLISHSRRTRAYRCLDEENGINLWYSKSLHTI